MAKLTDRQKAKRDYIGGGISYGQIAKKYKISASTVKRWAKADGWQEARAQVETKMDSQMPENVAQTLNGLSQAVTGAAETLMQKLLLSLQNEPDVMEPKRAREYTAVLRDIKALSGEYTGQELEEAMAKIEKIRTEAEQKKLQNQKITGDDKQVTVSMEGLEDYAG